MAFLREVLRPCQSAPCKRTARVELVTARNATYGYYCRACGKRMLTQQLKHERPTKEERHAR